MLEVVFVVAIDVAELANSPKVCVRDLAHYPYLILAVSARSLLLSAGRQQTPFQIL